MIKQSKYAKGLILLLSGTVVSQFVTFIFTPIISRLFLPEQIGVFTLILSVVNMFGTIICARYDMVIISAKDEDDVYSLISLSIVIGIILSFFITIGFLIYTFFNTEIRELIGIQGIVIFPILLTYTAMNILTAYNNRHNEYSIISQVNILRATVQGVLQSISGLLGFGALSLAVSHLLSNLAGARLQAHRLIKSNYSLFSSDKEKVVNVLKKYGNQPLFSVPAIFFNSASYSLLPFFINHLFGAREVGLYSISFRLLGIPLALISTNVSKVFFQRASHEYNTSKDFSKIYLKTAIFLLIVALPVSGLLYFLGEHVITIIFGSNWISAGKYIKVLAPMYGIRLIVSALSVSMIISEKQKYEMMMQSLFLLATVVTFLFASVYELGITEFLFLINILFSVNYLIYGYIGYYFSQNRL